MFRSTEFVWFLFVLLVSEYFDNCFNFREDLCESKINLPMCPTCDKKCDYTNLADSCVYTKVSILFVQHCKYFGFWKIAKDLFLLFLVNGAKRIFFNLVLRIFFWSLLETFVYF